jgi:valyl-tRNA synthetase
MSLYAVSLRFPFTGTKEPNPNNEKQPETIIPPPPNFTGGTIHLGR